MCGGVVACRSLHAKCPRFFSQADLEIQEAYELLTVAQTGIGSAKGVGGSLDIVHLSNLVQRALRAFEQHVSRVDLTEVSRRLRAVGACRGLIALCARIARSRDPNDETLRPQDYTSMHVQQLHYSRLECYQVVLEIFEELIVSASTCRGLTAGQDLLHGYVKPLGSTSSMGMGLGLRVELPELLPVPVAPDDATPVLDALLRYCLESQPQLADEFFSLLYT